MRLGLGFGLEIWFGIEIVDLGLGIGIGKWDERLGIGDLELGIDD